MTVLAYDPQRLATLARTTQAAADELAPVSSDEPYAGDAVATAHGVATSLDETLLASLRAVLTSTALTQWNADGPTAPAGEGAVAPVTDFMAWLLTVDDLVALLDQQVATDPASPFVLTGDEFSLAGSVTASQPMQWFHEINPGCVPYAGGSYQGGGYVTGPDDESYPIVVPRVVTEDGAVYSADLHPAAPGEPSVANLGGSDPGWEVVGFAIGIERFQAEPSAAAVFAAFWAGTTGLVKPLPPNSSLGYVAMPVNGPPYLTDQPPVPAPVVAPPDGGAPDPADSSAGAVLEAGVALGVTAAQGVVMAGGMDNQTERAYQVIFEHNDNGDRLRARIVTCTLADNGDGGVAIIPEYVFVNGEGELTAQTVSYGNPYETPGVHITSSTDDVPDYFLSGDEPLTHPVYEAVFP